MKITPIFLALGLISVQVNAMRCGNRIIDEGSYQHEVLEYCGTPVSSSDKTLTRTRFISAAEIARTGLPERYTRVEGGIEITEQSTLEEWIYNFGIRRLQKKVEFQDGKVSRITSLDYGY